MGSAFMRRTIALLATALLTVGAAQARSGAVSIPLDEVRMVAFAKPVATLYVGNPMIADITMIDKRHAFVLGKAFGATNIIALDSAGRQISNNQVFVSGGGGGGVVTLQKGSARVTYSCAARRCEMTPRPGDSKDLFETNMDEIQKHQDAGAKSSGGQAQ
jgi:Pilus formation protein N terminal region